MKCFKALLALAVLGAASAAVAQNSDGRPYIYAGGIMVLPDDRTEESDESFGGMFGYGIPLVNTDLPYLGNKLDLEFSGVGPVAVVAQADVRRVAWAGPAFVEA